MCVQWAVHWARECKQMRRMRTSGGKRAKHGTISITSRTTVAVRRTDHEQHDVNEKQQLRALERRERCSAGSTTGTTAAEVYNQNMCHYERVRRCVYCIL